jgi:glycosyltransferase involved in cell wall biosynthesis
MTDVPGGLYLCYFGLREPLVQTQVLPYLREIVKGGTRMSLLTFEPELKGSWSSVETKEWKERLRRDGIEWHALPYHKRPSLPATLYDIVRGAIRTVQLVRREHIDIIHARSHVGATIGAIARRITGARLIFDFRGLMAEEYVESGNWRANGMLFNITKAVERWLLRSSDGFVVLTERLRVRLFPDERERPVAVIPCCVDETRFVSADRELSRAELGVSSRIVFTSIGTLGGYYMTRELAELFAIARELDPRVYLLVVTKASPTMMVAQLQRLGMPPDAYRILQSDVEDIPKHLSVSDVGLCLIRPSQAQEASSPTKFAEYLAAGLPVIIPRGVGDLDAEVEEGGIGVLLDGFDREAFVDACRRIDALRRDPELSERCREHARTRYGLRSIGGERYRQLYRALLERSRIL